MTPFKRSYIKLTFLLAIAFCIISAPAIQAQEADSYIVYEEGFTEEEVEVVSTDSISGELPLYRFNAKQFIAPGILLAAGVAGVWAYPGLKNYIRDNFSVRKGGHTTKVDDYIQYVPIPVYIGLGFIPGIKHRSGWRERVMAGVTAYAVMAIVNNVMKVSFKEYRPDNSRRNSFPSGHTATAFTGAELMRIEYGNWVGLAGYAVAATVGVLRIYNDKHWINDVLGGAAIGILSARIAYWLLPWERKLFKLDKKNTAISSAIIAPMAGATNGFLFSLEF